MAMISSLVNTLISGSSGNDTIRMSNVSYSTIDGGAGNDTIDHVFNLNFNSINGGAGNDVILMQSTANTISSGGTGNTIVGGKGNDTIKLGGDTYGLSGMNFIHRTFDTTIEYSSGDGDDVIDDVALGYSRYKIKLLSGKVDSSVKSSEGLVLKIGTGSITIKKTGYGVKIVGNEIIVNDRIDSYTNWNYSDSIAGGLLDSATLSGNSSKTTLSNGGAYDLIQGTFGRIENTGDKVTVNASDSIPLMFGGYASGTRTLVNGGSKNDSIYVQDDENTINGGAGNDYIWATAGHKSVLNGGAGNDFINNNFGNQYVTINGGTGNDSIQAYGKNGVIQYTSGDGKDTIYGYDSSDTIQIFNPSSYSTQQSGSDIIVNVDAGSMLLKNAKGKTLNIVTLSGGGSEPTTPGGLTYVKLTNKDKSPYTAEDKVGTISGAEERTKAIKITGNDNANVIIGGKKNDTLTGGAGNDIFVSGAGKDVVTDYAEGDVISLTGALTKATTKNSDVTLTIGKGSLNLKGVKGKKVTLIDSKGDVTKQAFGEKSITVIDGDGDTINTAIDAAVITVDASARTEDVVLIGNSKANTIIGGGGNDELTGGKGKDLFIYTGGNDIINDYKASDDKIKLDGAAIKSMEYVGTQGTDLVITTDKGTLTIENAVSLKSSKGKIVKTPQKITLIQSDGTTTSQTYQFATATGEANTMSGGTGADTLYGLSGSDLLIGGKGKDVFVYGAGKDTVSDYTAKQDKIKFTAVTTEYEVEDKDVIFKFVDSGNTLRVVNGKDKAITVIDSTGKENTATYNDPTELVLKKTDSGKFDKSGDSKVVTIDASKTTKGVEIIANSNDNIIIAGKGRDTLTGGAGTDTFVYTNGNGNDIITDYKASEGDIIQLGKKTTISKATVSGDDYVFTIGKGKLTVKGGASQNITFVDVDDNEIVYKKRASRNYAELFDDDNFATDELISILDTNVNITNIDYDNDVANLTEENKFVSISYNQQHEK